ncbi:MAG: hypothetical protein JRJ59_09275, partial [Deltaproteobacteria bacterium]|nr:hypothetical protein [Deltaproteobacteria bacterium]
AGPASTIEAQVEGVDLKDVLNPRLAVRVTKGSAALAAGQKATLTVSFAPNARGCIDWSKPANRAQAFVLGLAPGDQIQARLTQAGDGWPVEDINLLALAVKLDFPGRAKIADGALISSLRFSKDKARIMILLGDYRTLSAQAADRQTRPQAAAEIKALQDRFLASLPAGVFELERRFELIPGLSGQTSLSGLRLVAAHPLVSFIEADQELSLGQSPAGGDRQEAGQ